MFALGQSQSCSVDDNELAASDETQCIMSRRETEAYC